VDALDVERAQPFFHDIRKLARQPDFSISSSA